MVLRKGLIAVVVALLLILPGCAGSRVANERKARQTRPWVPEAWSPSSTCRPSRTPRSAA